MLTLTRRGMPLAFARDAVMGQHWYSPRIWIPSFPKALMYASQNATGGCMGGDARGLAVLLSSLKILQDNKVRTVGDVLFVASVGEEQLGNLRGMRALFSSHPEIDGMVGLEFSTNKDSELVSVATASHRYDVSFT